MRTKSVPPAPDSLEFLSDAQNATPLVPEPHESCCIRLATRLEGVDKDEARSWLAFMQALGLVEEGELGYVRTSQEVSVEALQDDFRSSIFGVEELLSHLDAAGAADVDTAFETFRSHVPQWERHRNPNTWETLWRERVGHLLEWARLFDLVEHTDGGYRVTQS